MNTVMKRVKLARPGYKEDAGVRRMPEAMATKLVASGLYVYATRSEWKANGRNMKELKL